MWPLALIFGMLVGFSLGLTGGGGAIFAVPLLTYGLNVAPRDAVGISLVSVGATSVVGVVQRALRDLVEFPTGLLIAFTGMAGAPVGSWLSRHTPEWLLMTLFACLMLMIAWRMWSRSRERGAELPILTDDNAGPTCRRDPEGKLRLTSPCAFLLATIGLVTGVLSGLFGVGGGFIIVPALVMFSGMGMQRAIGTSLLIITLVSFSGTVSYLLTGGRLSPWTIVLFTTGSVMGLFIGTSLGRRLAGSALQRGFAGAIVLVATYVLLRTLTT